MATAATGVGAFSAKCTSIKLNLTIPVEIDGEQLMKALKRFELVDTSRLSKIAKDDTGLLPQPIAPAYRLCLVEVYVRSEKYGGSDKSANGHRYDSIAFANGMINNGMSCQLIHYVHDEHDQFFDVMKNFDAIIVRCSPGQIGRDGGSQRKFDDAMRALQRRGVHVWPSPDVAAVMGAKDALTKLAPLTLGLPDTLSYRDEASFAAGFKKTMAFQPRVIKQNRGCSGEGVWIVRLKEGNYCDEYGDRLCDDDEVLELMEANDSHMETHTVREFIEFCANGRSDRSGTWASRGEGGYLRGGMLVDQRFCPRIVEGELRYSMVGPSLVGIIHKKPRDGGFSAGAGQAEYTFYGPREPLFQKLTQTFLSEDLPAVMPSLGLGDHPFPLWWTADFINASPVGTKPEDEKWIVGELNCSCVGISKCLPANCSFKGDAPTAGWNDIPDNETAEAMAIGNMIGKLAKEILSA